MTSAKITTFIAWILSLSLNLLVVLFWMKVEVAGYRAGRIDQLLLVTQILLQIYCTWKVFREKKNVNLGQFYAVLPAIMLGVILLCLLLLSFVITDDPLFVLTSIVYGVFLGFSLLKAPRLLDK